MLTARNFAVDFSRVGLTCDGDDIFEAHFLGKEQFEFFHFCLVAVEEGEKTGLCAGRAFDRAERQLVEQAFEIFKIAVEIVAPESGAFSDGG